MRGEDGVSSLRSAWGLDTGREEPWQDQGLCRQVDTGDMWFPEKGGSTREGKRVCVGCPVRQECLDYALTNDERFGIWGGYSERERRKLKQGHQIELIDAPQVKTCSTCHSELPRGDRRRYCSTDCKSDALRQQRKADAA